MAYWLQHILSELSLGVTWPFMGMLSFAVYLDFPGLGNRMTVSVEIIHATTHEKSIAIMSGKRINFSFKYT